MFSRQQILEYRASILPVRQKAQEEIDKQVLTISAAALGLSLTFYKDVLKEQIVSEGWLLRVAWTCWIISIASVVFSMYLSSEAVRLTIRKIDQALEEVDEEQEVKFDFSTAGGWAGQLLRFNNYVNLMAFLAGILSFALVFLVNVNTHAHQKDRNESRRQSTATARATTIASETPGTSVPQRSNP